MQADLLAILNTISGWVWGPPTLVLLVGTGIYLSWILRGLQIRILWHALYLALVVRREKDDEPGDISHFQALMTALAATVGTGNIAGVATAISTGGPGALFWMWVTGFVGMATKYAEAVLAVRYRRLDAHGQMCGGPMYYLSEGLGMPWLGTIFAIFTAIAGFGIGNMVQSNSVAHAAQETFGVAPLISGLIMAVATGVVILGGIQWIGRAASLLVPVMIIFYVVASLIVLGMYADRVIPTIIMVCEQAFTPTAASGGFAGSAVMLTIRMGVARGVFSNESGLGSAPIAAAAAKTRYPVAQAMVSMTQTFIDTIIVCSMTGLVILVTGEWDSGATGSALTAQAFGRALPGGAGGVVVAIGLILFAYTTLLGWSYYGEKAVEYLIGERAIPWYRGVWCVLIAVGAVAQLDLVWTFADVMNGLMALPNLVGLIGLSGIVVAETKKYFAEKGVSR